MKKYPLVVDKPWGSEIRIINNEKYCGKILVVKKGQKNSKQYHRLKDETLYVLEGEILLEFNKKTLKLKPGELVRIEPKNIHRYTGLKDSRIIEISTQHFDEDTYVVK